MAVEHIPPYARGELVPEAQDEEQATYADPLDKSELAIDWSRTAREIHNQVRALSPKPGAYTLLRGKRIKILRARVGEGKRSPGSGVVDEREGGLLLAGTGEGVLQVEEVQPEGKKPMSAGEFLRGFRPQAGESFGNPRADVRIPIREGVQRCQMPEISRTP